MRAQRFWVIATSLLVMWLTGCAQTVRDVATDNRVKINQLHLGMDRGEVDRMMGPGTATVRRVGPFSTTQMTNPHRTEAVRGKSGETIEVRYYGTDVVEGEYDDEFSFTEDELTPLVFRDGQLIGWGWNLLFEHVDKSQLHFRYKSNRPDIDS